MPRPKKENLDYFPLDSDFFTDSKIKILKAKFGADGIAVYLYILCEIYRDKGYYVECDEDFVLVMSDYFRFSENKTMQILEYLFSRSLLVKSKLSESVTVITAKSVQRRYQAAKKASIKKEKGIFAREVIVDERIWLLKKEETEPPIKVQLFEGLPEKNENLPEENNNKSMEKSLKESKVKERKGESVPADADTPSPFADYQAIIDLFNKICTSLPKAQNVSDKRKKQIRSIIRQFNPDFKSVFEKIEKSDFLTGRNGKWNGCGFDWIMNPSNFVKIIEGNYDNKEGNHAEHKRTDEQDPQGGKYGTYL